MLRVSTTALVLALLAATPSLAHEQPVVGVFSYEIATQYHIGGGVYQTYAGVGSATTINDFTVQGNHLIYFDPTFMVGHATLSAARGDLWISYFGFMDDIGDVYGFFSIDGGTKGFEHHYGGGWIAASLKDNWIYIDGVKDHPE